MTLASTHKRKKRKQVPSRSFSLSVLISPVDNETPGCTEHGKVLEPCGKVKEPSSYDFGHSSLDSAYASGSSWSGINNSKLTHKQKSEQEKTKTYPKLFTIIKIIPVKDVNSKLPYKPVVRSKTLPLHFTSCHTRVTVNGDC